LGSAGNVLALSKGWTGVTLDFIQWPPGLGRDDLRGGSGANAGLNLFGTERFQGELRRLVAGANAQNLARYGFGVGIQAITCVITRCRY